jgi:hypothetical protein
MSRAKSLKGKLTQTIDSAIAWVGPSCMGQEWRAQRGCYSCSEAGQPAHKSPPTHSPPLLPGCRPQETHIAEALGPKYWLVASRHMFQTRILVFARMDVVPFVTE